MKSCRRPMMIKSTARDRDDLWDCERRVPRGNSMFLEASH
jgi:hypothetical protein